MYITEYYIYIPTKKETVLTSKATHNECVQKKRHLTSDSEINIAHLHIQSCGPQNTLIKTICD